MTSTLSTKQPRFSRRVLRDDVHDYIVDLLLSGDLKPGSALNIDSLSRQLDVSPTPIREALVQLEHTGLVRREALKGYKVAPLLSRNQMQELFDARAVVEVAAIERAAQNLPVMLPLLMQAHENHQEAAALFEGMEGSKRVAGYRKYFEADWRFHQTILENCGNRYLQQMAESTSTHSHRMRQSAGHGSNDTALAVHEHAVVLGALQDGDADGARRALADHIGKARGRALLDV